MTPSLFNEDLGIQSFCFRNFEDNREVAKLLLSCGVRAVEICGIHADFKNVDAFQSVLEPYLAAGITIRSLGTNTLSDNVEETRIWCECARLGGIKYLSMSFDPVTSPASWKVAERLGEEYDVWFGIHNHGGRHWLGSSEMLAHVFAHTNRRVGLCLDTAWALDSGENIDRMIEQFSERLYGIHLKDFIFGRNRQRADTVVGTGNLDLATLIPKLKQLPHLGSVVIEYEADQTNPVPALKQCVEKVRTAAGAA